MIEARNMPIDQIKIRERARKDMGDLDDLARSMAEIGLVQAVSVDPEGVLHDGERRCRAAIELGWTTIPAMVIDAPALRAEYDANVVRKAFTPGERVALAKRIEADTGERRGRPRANGEIVQDLAQFEPGEKTADVAARKAGFGNRETYRQAKTVVEQGPPELVAAMNAGDVSISGAFAQLEPEQPKPPKLPTPKQAMEIAKTQPGLLVPARDGYYHCHLTDEERELGDAYMTLHFDIIGESDPLDPALAARAVPSLFAARIDRRAQERRQWIEAFMTLRERHREPQ